MDILELKKERDAEEVGVELPIFQKDGDPYLDKKGEQCTISVVGSDSKQVTGQHRRQQQKRLNRGAKKLTQMELEKAQMDSAVAGVTGWSGWDAEGEPAECSPDNVRLMFINAPWIQRQVEEGISSHSDFIDKPSTS